MEVTKPWSNNDINKYYIITRDKETNEWKFFNEIVGHTVFWKDEPSRYGMTKSKAIEVLNIVKSLTKEDVKPEDNKPTDSTTPTEPSGEDSGTTTPTDTPTEPSESNGDTPTNTDGETSTEENEDGETASTSDTEPNTEPSTPTEPVTPVEEPQYKIITISSVTYNSTEVAIFDDVDYNKLKSTLTYIDSTYPNTVVHVVTKSDTGKSIFYFYLESELTWFLELKTNIDYSLVSNVTTLDDIKKLL